MKKILLLLLLVASMAANAAIGTWHTYPAFSDISKIVNTGDMVFVLASGNMYSYTPSDQHIQTYDKNTVLSDCGIKDMAWSARAGRLIVVYDNYNIDLLSPTGQVINIPDYYNKTMTEDKHIYGIDIEGSHAYLATGFGILRINMADGTVSNTYNVGLKVNATAITGNTLYAATTDGIYKVDMNTNPADKNNWKRFSSGVFGKLFALGGQLIGMNSGNMCTVNKDNGQMRRFSSVEYTSAVKDGDRIIAYGRTLTSFIKVVDGYVSQLTLNNFQCSGIACSGTENMYWVNGEGNTLDIMKVADDKTTSLAALGIKPDGPAYNYFGFMRYMNGRLYTSGGLGSPTRPACVQIYNHEDDSWTVYDDSFKAQLDHRYQSAYAIDIDPRDPGHLVMGSASGVYEFKDGEMIKNHTIDNSPLQAAKIVTDPAAKKNYTLVTYVRFDPEGRMWCLNGAAPSASIFSLENGEWKNHHKSVLISNEGYSMETMTSLFFDDRRDLMWFCSKDWRKPALVCYQPSTDGIRIYNNFVNQNGTSFTAEQVNCAVEDYDGNIWIGTAAGPFMLTARAIADDENYFHQVIVPRNDGTDYGDYLLSGVAITAMAIDGAGRKWFGTTNNGVYLISADNMTQIEHFTTDNSILLSNVIESIAIDGNTGEVFFGTDKGLCSYMGDATDPVDDMSDDDVYVYPNPVKPDYTGLITVMGLSLDADVKIVTASGALVAEGRSNGGMFTWDGCDKKGRRVASGVYMVLAARSDGSKGAVCKIAVIN